MAADKHYRISERWNSEREIHLANIIIYNINNVFSPVYDAKRVENMQNIFWLNFSIRSERQSPCIFVVFLRRKD